MINSLNITKFQLNLIINLYKIYQNVLQGLNEALIALLQPVKKIYQEIHYLNLNIEKSFSF